MKLPSILLAVATTAAFSQGPLAPSGAPAPTQKSLQEIWDRLSTQQAQITSLQKQLTAVSGMDAVSPAGQALPWNIQTVLIPDKGLFYGGPLYVWSTSLAFGPDGEPAISYSHDLDDYTDVKAWTRFDGKAWTRSLESNVYYPSGVSSTSLAFGPDGQPAISYYDSHYLKLDRFNGTAWSPTFVDTTGYVGAYCSLAFGPDGQPAISYHDVTNGDLKFARFNGTAWSLTTVDNAINVGKYTSLAFGPDGQPAISYYDDFNWSLKLARFNGTAWSLTTVASTGNTGLYSSLAFGPDRQPSISYYNYNYPSLASGRLDFSRFNGTSWLSTTVDSTGNVGADTSLAFGPDGQPAISYYDMTNRDLKFARFNGTAWSQTTVDSSGDVGAYTSLAFGPDGQPAISYVDVTNFAIKFARKGLFHIAQ